MGFWGCRLRQQAAKPFASPLVNNETNEWSCGNIIISRFLTFCSFPSPCIEGGMDEGCSRSQLLFLGGHSIIYDTTCSACLFSLVFRQINRWLLVVVSRYTPKRSKYHGAISFHIQSRVFCPSSYMPRCRPFLHSICHTKNGVGHFVSIRSPSWNISCFTKAWGTMKGGRRGLPKNIYLRKPSKKPPDLHKKL